MCYTILHVEDDTCFQTVIKRILEKSSDFSVTPVESIHRAEVLLCEGCFDAVLLDLNLPDSRGIETLHIIKSVCPHTPVIILSGEDEEEIGLQAVEEGADNFFKKTWEFKSLAHNIKSAIVRCKNQVELEQTLSTLTEMNNELRKAKNLYESVVNISPEWICRHKPDGTITFVNKTICDAFDTTYENLVGLNMFDFIDPEYRELARKNINKLTPKTPWVYGSEFRHRNKYWVAWRKVGLFDDNGDLLEIQSVGEDKTQFYHQFMDVADSMKKFLSNVKKEIKISEDYAKTKIAALEKTIDEAEEMIAAKKANEGTSNSVLKNWNDIQEALRDGRE